MNSLSIQTGSNKEVGGVNASNRSIQKHTNQELKIMDESKVKCVMNNGFNLNLVRFMFKILLKINIQQHQSYPIKVANKQVIDTNIKIDHEKSRYHSISSQESIPSGELNPLFIKKNTLKNLKPLLRDQSKPKYYPSDSNVKFHCFYLYYYQSNL